MDPLRELLVLDGNGGDPGKRDTEFEIVFAESMTGFDVVDVQHAECVVFAPDERAANGRANLLHDDRLAAKTRVLPCIVRENRNLVVQRGPRDGLRDRTVGGAAVFLSGDLWYELVAIEQE